MSNAHASGSTNPVDRLVAAILQYVNAHPNASDTAEGVGRWWIADEFAHASAAQLDCALDRLVARGALTRRTLPDGRLVFTARIAQAGAAALED